MTSPREALELLDWKRQIFDLYARVRESSPDAGWQDWVTTRTQLFKAHPQSPIPSDRRDSYEGGYYPYDRGLRVHAETRPAEPESYDIPTSGTDTMRFTRIGTCHFELHGAETSLEMYWLDAYAGGLFVPFRDKTSGDTTYGAGRYLLDTVKGADLGTVDDKLVLDFNFAYNPSCAYDPRWVCPLAPPPNRLDVAIEAGEKSPAP